MRKPYEKPEMTEVESIPSTVLSTSFYIVEESQGDFKEDFVVERRGTWGNLWEDNYWEKTYKHNK